MKTLQFVWRGHSCPRRMQRQIRLASKSARTTLSLRGLMQLRNICTVALIVFLASTPLALAQNDDAAAQKHGQSMYAPLSRTPAAARIRKNPFEGDTQEAVAGGNSSNNIAPTVTAEKQEAQEVVQACCGRKYSRQRPARFSGSSPMALSGEACRFGRTCPSRSAGRSSHFCNR